MIIPYLAFWGNWWFFIWSPKEWVKCDQFRFIPGKNVPSWWVMLIMGGGVCMCEWRGMCEISIPSSEFCCKPKTNLIVLNKLIWNYFVKNQLKIWVWDVTSRITHWLKHLMKLKIITLWIWFCLSNWGYYVYFY